MRRHLLILVGLLLGTVAIYHQAMSFPYVYEDWQRTTADVHLSWRPGQWLGDWLWQGHAATDHALNLLVHFVNITLVYGLLVRFGMSQWAWLGAGVFAWHPIQAEAVAYASGRSELLVTACALGVVWILTRDDLRSWDLGLVVLLAWLACGVKQTGVIVPLLALGLVGWRRPRWGYWLLPVACLALLGLPELFWRNSTALMAWPTWMRMESTALAQLLLTLVLPWRTTIEHDPAGVPLALQYVALVGVFAVGYLTLVSVVKAPQVAVWWGVAWMGVVLAPRFLLIMPSAPLNEHHFALAMPGVAWVASSLLEAV